MKRYGNHVLIVSCEAPMRKEKKLCKWKQTEIRDDMKKLKKLVKKSKYVCEKCGRTAKIDGLLCRPSEL